MFFLPLLLGLVAALVGVAPPGLLNLMVAKLSAVEGKKSSLFFAVGACVVVIFQTYLALLSAEFLYKNPDVIKVLQQVGVLVFLVLTIYFFRKGKSQHIAKDLDVSRTKKSYFLSGMLLSSLNLLPIPYYVFLSLWFSRNGLFSFIYQQEHAFVFGVLIGTFVVFYLYMLFFKKKTGHSPNFFSTYANYIIGTITGLIALLTMIKIIYK
jgi:threonine/homoserine/homoserine lactone efflux protein